MRQGFTLIQISILLTVAALVLVAVLPSGQTKLNADRASRDTLNELLLSLRQYEAANGKLPCPADASQPIGSSSYGRPASNSGATGNCSGGTPAANYSDTSNNVAIGLLPVRALGLSNEFALDAYGRDITYAVDTNATVCGWPSKSLIGKITVTDKGVANKTVAALVSHGSDGHGAWVPLTGSTGTAVRLNAGSTDAAQLTNAHVDSSFAPTTVLTNFISTTPTATFDDLLVYKSPQWSTSTLPFASPEISFITPPPDGCYSTGQSLTFTLTYSASVTVTGTPRLMLTIGSNTRYAAYTSGSGSTVLTFSYTVQSGDSAPNGISMNAALDPNGGTVMSGSFCVPLGLSAPDLSRVKVNDCGYFAIASGASPYVTLYTFSNGVLTKLPQPTTLPYVNNNYSGPKVEFSSDNSVLAWGGDWDNANPGILYTVRGSGLTYSATYNTGSDIHDNKFSSDSTYLAVAEECCTGFQIYKKSGGTYTTSGITITPAPGCCGVTAVTWAPDDSKLYVLGNNDSTFPHTVQIYNRSGDTFTLASSIDTQATAGGWGQDAGLSLHPSGKYLAVAMQSSTAGYFPEAVIKNPSTSPTVISVTGSGLTESGAIAIQSVAWSPNGTFLAVSYWGDGGITLRMYSFDSGTDKFTPATIAGTNCPVYNNSVAWSKDGNYLAVTGSDPTYPLCMFSRSGTTFTRMALDPSLMPAGPGYGVTFSK